ncbi:MAG: electron transport complex subunit RsxE [Erysipelotrichaceae bacterium]
MNRRQNFTAGFIRENPVFALYLGLCSVLAISTSLNNALGMGVCVIIVTILSNVIVSAIRKITPNEIRIPVYIVVIATLVKAIQLLVKAFAPDLDAALGLFIPLIVVNCIILGRAEAFASKNGILDSAIDGLGMGLGYTIGLVILSAIRQILSTGILNLVNPFSGAEIFSLTIIPESFTISIFGSAFGAFITFALIAAGVSALKARAEAKANAKEAK